jgi:hypothetical protein
MQLINIVPSCPSKRLISHISLPQLGLEGLFVNHLLLLQLLVESVGLSGALSALPWVKVSFNGWSGLARDFHSRLGSSTGLLCVW